ncbi:helix-turn-helix transcriptional regulator [Shimia sp. R10_1]|uniref:helix-turn-helix transcriptional regulator n=1 Tax=Shimia sp. R10_1 TaxID=2821095 RepID=UPI001ADBE928|nr:AraC family transcriptional regulator [Shimia sp. R10_1]MBO9473641.1 helix-turn-helix transcriptional regulator [Shimia sp. R10_1]
MTTTTEDYKIYFASEQGSDAVWPYSVPVGGRTLAHHNSDMVRRNYNEHVLIYTLSGEGHVDIGDTRFLAKAETLAWIDTARAYAHGAGATAPWRYVWLSIRGQGIDRLFDRLGFASNPIAPKLASVAGCFENILHELSAEAVGESAQINAEVAQILAALSASRHAAIGSVKDEPMAELKSHLRRDLQKAWRIPDLAQITGLSHSQLFRRFRDEAGVSPIVWLRRERMAVAAYLLRSTDERVAQIAIRCGYPDPFHFSRDFKLEKGCAPRNYRSKYRA